MIKPQVVRTHWHSWPDRGWGNKCPARCPEIDRADGREREGIDLSKILLTHHHLTNLGKRALPLSEGETPKIEPITDTGGGVQEKEKALLDAIIQKVNDLFGFETTDQEQLVYVNHAIMGKMLESETLRQQAANNTKEQFATSPDLKNQLTNAIMAAYDAHTLMSTQALNFRTIQSGILDILLNHSHLWETLRAKAAEEEAAKTP